MLLAPPTTVLLLARFFNFIRFTTLSAGSDLKTIVILFDKPSAQLTNEILCSFRQQSLYVSCFTVNIDDDLQLYDVVKLGLTLTFAIFEKNPEKNLLYGLKKFRINPYTHKNNNIFVYPFELTDNDIFLSEFMAMPNRMPIILACFVDNDIKVIFRSDLFNRKISLNELQFQNIIRNLFYRPYDNVQSQHIDVIVMPEPPTSFSTISTKVISGSSEQSQMQDGVAGADLYLTQLIAECLNGKAKFRAIAAKFNEKLNSESPEFIDIMRNKYLVPLKSPDLPAINDVEFLSNSEYWR